MKLQFDSKLDYQLDAIASIVNLFDDKRLAARTLRWGQWQ